LRARACGALRGEINVPGDKSISHRSLILGALAVGETAISGLLEGEDVLHTAAAMRALGAQVERRGEGHFSVHGVGVGGFITPATALDFGNSGTGCRLVMGAVAGAPVTARFDGDASLRARPMRRVLDPLQLIGARVVDGSTDRLPLTLAGARDPVPVTYHSPVASAQVKSAVLLAGLAAPGITTVIENAATRDHTEVMLRQFGAHVSSTPEGQSGRRISVTGQAELHSARVVVPGDPSSAAFPIVAALIRPGSDIVINDVMTNPLRNGLLTTLREMGATIEENARPDQDGETMAQLRVTFSALRGVEVPASRAPAMIDEYPVLAVAAAFAEGTTIMRGLHELRVKESDRLAATLAMLAVNGVAAEISGDDLIVVGKGEVAGGGLVTTHMDHRISMAALVMGCGSRAPVTVDDIRFIATSFPDFTALMGALGADLS